MFFFNIDFKVFEDDFVAIHREGHPILEIENPTIDDILERFEQSIMRQGTRICVIDPYNFIRTDNIKGKLMTDVVSDLLSKVQNFCRKN